MKRILSLVVAFAAALAWGKDVTWTGKAGDGLWNTAGNWDGTIANGDRVIFSPAGDLTVTMSSAGAFNARPGSLCFESGNTTLKYDDGSKNTLFYLQGPDENVFVAENATATIVLNYRWNSWSDDSAFRKTGGGKLFIECDPAKDYVGFGHNDLGKARKSLTVEEGALEFTGTTTPIHQSRCYTTNIIVKAGAELHLTDGTRLQNGPTTVIDLQGDSVLRLTDAQVIYFAALSGTGSVIGEQGTDHSTVHLYLTRAAEPFYGTMSGNLWLDFDYALTNTPAVTPFVVWSANQLADIKSIRNLGPWFQYAAGVGGFNIGKINGNMKGTNWVQDVNGDPIVLRTGAMNTIAQRWAGPGDVWIAGSDGGIPGSFCSLTGWLGAMSGNLNLGYNGDDFDLTAAGSVKGVRTETDGTVQFVNTSFAEIEKPVRGSGTYYVNTAAGVRFHDLCLQDAKEMRLDGPTEFAAGDVSVKTITGKGGTTRINRITGGRLYYGKSKGTLETETALESRNGVTTSGSYGLFSIELAGGEYWWVEGNATKDIFLRGGKFYPSSGAIRHMTAKCVEDSPAQIVFDGGEAVMQAKSNTSYEFLHLQETYDMPEYLRAYVAARGGRLTAKRPNGRTGDFTFSFPLQFQTCTNTVTSGILAFSGWGDFTFGAPMALNGPVAFRDGTAVLSAKQLAGGAAPFGTGDLCLRSARLFCDARTGAGHGVSEIPLVTGAESALVYEGACEIAARHANANTAAKAITINRIRRAGKGSVLFLRDGVSDNSTFRRIGEGSYSTVKLANPPASDPNSGLPCQPVIIGMVHGEWPAVYDAEKGFVPYDSKYPTVSTLVDSTSSTLLVPTGSKLALAENQIVYAAGVRCGNWSGISTGTNARLIVGNGTDPAIICLSVCGTIIGGNGYVDFGTSEGVIVVGNVTYDTGGVEPADDWGTFINSHLTGSGGVSFVADPHLLRNQHVALLAAAYYTGDTRISAVRVLPKHVNCFSSGDVYLFGGEASGGAVVFKMAGTWANGFHIAGHGYRDSSKDVQASSKGCIEFKANATLSGPVEIVEEASVNATNNMTGTFSGVVSGDRLKLFKSEGIVKLTNANTYTGGTEVAQSTLVVTREGGLGTGELLVDNGLVEFENTAAITVANKLRGIGTLRVKNAAVNFTGDAGEAEDVTVDYAGVNVRLTSYPTFATVTNSSATRTMLTLAAPGAYTIDPAKFAGANIRLVLEAGATLDLMGGTLTVERFTGDKSAVNGTIVETNPRGGLMLIVR